MRRNTWKRAALAAVGTVAMLASPVFGATKILINFEPEESDLDGDISEGSLSSLADSAIVQRLADADPNMTAEQIATMIKADIVAVVQNIYSEIDVEITTDPDAEGVTKTVHVVGGARDVDGSLGFVRGLNSSTGWVMIDQYDEQNVWLEPNEDRKLTKAEAANAIGKTIAHEFGHLFGLPDVNTMRADNRHTPGKDADPPTEGASPGVKPGAGTMVQGICPDKTPFKEAHEKQLIKDLGGTDDEDKKKKKDEISIGDADLFGADETGRAGFEDRVLPVPLPPSAIGLTGPEFNGTDELFAGPQFLPLPLPIPPDFDPLLLDSAFLEIRFWNVPPEGIVDIQLEGLSLMGGPMNEFQMLNQNGEQFGAVLIDLEQHIPLPVLQGIVGDGVAQLQVIIDAPLWAMDYVRFRLFSDCTGDVNGDGFVDFTDLNILLSQYGMSGPGLTADLNGDGFVDFTDLNILLSAYGNVC